jgi:hypothetical protein|tara:strand:- start:424 stop:804 length:381 start_codon:yes stop_codon:yes gene_type:complete
MSAPGLVKAGIASMRVNGKPVTVMGNVVIGMGTELRETLKSATGPVGFKAESGTPALAFQSVHDSSIDLKELFELAGVTITLTLRDGTAFAYTDAWSLSPGDFETEEGKIELAFNALSIEQVSSAS